MNKLNLVVLGGTFDVLHNGHKTLIRSALGKSKLVYIGITSDIYTSRIKPIPSIESYQLRRKALAAFLKQEGVLPRVKILPIDSNAIPKVWENLPIDGIFVSENSKKGAESINAVRQKQKKPVLPLFFVPMIIAEDGGVLSSTRIRSGEVNREGKMYFKEDWFKKILYLPDALRLRLKKPFGSLLPSNFRFSDIINDTTITVGDVTTKLFLQKGIKPKIAVIDFVVERKKVFNSFSELGFVGTEKVKIVTNPPGQLTPLLFTTIKHLFKEKNSSNTILKIDGEEDLVVLPMILASPLGNKIYYGQPGVGTVEVAITEQIKKVTYSLVDSFKMKVQDIDK